MKKFVRLLTLATMLPMMSAPLAAVAQESDFIEAISPSYLIDWQAGEGAPTTQIPVTIPAEAAEVEFGFAVIVEPVGGANNGIKILINGTETGSAPLVNGNKLIYKVEQVFTQVGGANTISFALEDGSPVAINSIQMFQLEDTTQDVHFHHFFGPRPSGRRAAPAMHSSQSNFDVLHYTWEVEPDMSSRQMTAKVTIEAKSLVDDLATVALDFDTGSTMFIDSVDLSPSSAGLTYSYNSTNDWIIINIPSADQPDTNETFTIVVEYHGEPTASAGAFGLNSYNRGTQPVNGKPIVYTFAEPYSARSWLPSKDVPADKALIDLKVTVPDPNIVVANGVLVSTTPLSGSRTQYHWSHGYPISTYLIAFCATEYAYAEDDYLALDGVTTMPVGHYVYLNSTGELSSVAGTIDIMEKFANMFGEYPYLDEKYVTMTWGGSFGMEHTTATSINNGNLTSESAGPGKSRRNIHELSHMWFGDYVSPQSFDHVWLNEGWATYCEALYREQDEGIASYHATVNAWLDASNNQTTPLVNSNADAFASNLVYRKGGIVLHMLRHVIGDEAFFQGAKDYLAAHAHGNAVSDDLKDAMAAASGMDLDEFFDDWVYGPGRPAYQWSYTLGHNSLTVYVRQTGSNFFEMPIDIVADLDGGSTHTFVFNNTEQNQTITFDTTGLDIVDVDFDPDRWIYRSSLTELSATPAPMLLSVLANQANHDEVTITWQSGGGSTQGFELYAETAPDTWTLVAGTGTLTSGMTSYVVSGMSGVSRNFRLRAIGTNDNPSAFTDIYRVSQTTTGGRRDFVPHVLIVDGYDRWDSQGRGAGHPWAAVHGAALDAAGVTYDTVANEQVISNAVLLQDYDAVFWALGEESTGEFTFDTTEQARVQAYLQGGGNLFVSGAEIGWDLARGASPNDNIPFYNNYLKADWLDDQWDGAYTATLTAGSPFAPASFSFDDGDDGIYFAEWDDVLAPLNGSSSAFHYDADTGSHAAIYFDGTFSGGTSPAKLFYMGLPFETIIDEQDREDLIASVITWFNIQPSGLNNQWMLLGE